MTLVENKDIHKALLRCLEWFAEFAEANDIEYFIDGGTLLGQVRDSKFIPWDDDIDVCLTRKEFERLLHLLKQAQLPEQLELHHVTSENPLTYNRGSAKLRIKGVKGYETHPETLLLKRVVANSGPALDIVPLDPVPRNKILAKIVVELARISGHLERMHHAKVSLTGIYRSRYIRRAVIAKMIPRWALNGVPPILRTLSGRSKFKFKWTYSLGDLYPRRFLDSHELFPTVKVKFEGLTVSAPARPERVLTSLYGPSYLELPPLEKRVRHFENLDRNLAELSYLDEIDSKSVGMGTSKVSSHTAEMPRKKIAWVVDGPAPYRIPIFEVLAKDCELDVFFLKTADPYRNWDLPSSMSFSSSVLRQKRLRFLGLTASWLSRSALSSLEKYDFVVLSGWNLLANLQILAFRRIKNRVIFYESTAESRRFNIGPIAWVRRFAFAKASAIFTPGIASAENARDLSPIGTKVVHSFNSIDVEHFKRPSQTSKNPDCHRYLFMGQFIPRKNIPLLIEAFEQVARSGDSLTICGYGKLEQQLRSIIKRSPIKNQIELVDRVGYQDLPAVYSNYDSLVLPSRVEVWGLVLNEALCMGLSAIASDVCGATPSMAHLPGFLSFREGSVADLAEKLVMARGLDYSVENSEAVRRLSSPAKFASDLIRTLGEL